MGKLTDKIAKEAANILLSVEDHNNPELTAFRLDICNSCILHNNERKICNSCGCFTEVKAKLKSNIAAKRFSKGHFIEETHCPMGYWNDKELANKYRKLYGLTLLK